MSFRILVVAATGAEAAVLGASDLAREGYEAVTLVTGVGTASTAWELQKWFSAGNTCDLAINIGIAGTYSASIGIGEVVMPVTDCFADSGIEDGDHFLTLFDAGLADRDAFPFVDGWLPADAGMAARFDGIARAVRAITAGTATGSLATREKMIHRFNPDIETMEGAAFFYICRQLGIPFLALRAISNRVEVRNRKNWDIPLALGNLGVTLGRILPLLY